LAREDANLRFLTGATRSQIEMGANVSESVEDLKDLATTIKRSLQRDVDWTTYHAETLAEFVDENGPEVNGTEHAVAERKAINLWRDGLSSVIPPTLPRSCIRDTVPVTG
jgi:hypothetical protein